ncbi:efflux RND transporter periplasmic adaptor subunit [Pseudomonas sp. NFACC32-1]|uniref:efflux RND transporter periplasmic adaptor subunit n=2 Tax=Pseudomonas TaxID=286 RepID=UPI0008771280|nr:RND family efflux transporter, MFP subunit [Pseudomonas sp. NFACC32-1]SFY19704.1 RND family efflux transporter, MFP subunit [Pseudomonas sp. NFACC47-1]SFY40880.1 RND family efflux transporter, MFP subunit [Pseudomonas sp. NFACC43]
MRTISGKILLAVAVLTVVAIFMTLRRGAEPAVAAPTVSSLSVEVVQARRQVWPQLLFANGALAPWQEAVINAETGNLRIASLEADVGSRVKKGQLLATLACDAVLAEERKQTALVAQAVANLEQARSNDRRARVVGQGGALSEQQREEYRIKVALAEADLAGARAELQSTRIRLRQTRIVAVDDGIVSARTALLGKVVAAGDELFRLVRDGRIEWQAELDARQLAQVQPGQVARLTLPGGQSLEGRVRLVSPTLNTKTSRALVYVSLPTDSPAQAGMYASGQIELAAREALTVPDTAVILRDGRSYVFTLNDDMRVVQRPVTVGRRLQQAVEILGGLDEPARIVRAGGAFLNDGASVSLVQSQVAQP